VDRIPSWTDRIQYHSLPDRSGELMPEPLDPDHPESSLHNYQSVNDGLDTSDHSPIFATFSLQICCEEIDESVAEIIEGMQSQMGYKSGVPDDGSDRGEERGGEDSGSIASGTPSFAGRIPGALPDADFASLHPMLRPLEVILTLRHVVVEYKGQMRSPRALNVVFPLPYEDSNEIPDRTKVVRAGTLFAFASAQPSESRESLTARLPSCLVSRASKLEGLHLLLKVSLDDNTKAQCVICMRDGGFIGAGSHVNTFLLPLNAFGLPVKDSTGKPVQVQFELKMEAYEKGGTMARSHGALLPHRGYAGSETGGSSVGGSPTRNAYTGRSAPGTPSHPYAHPSGHSPARHVPSYAPVDGAPMRSLGSPLPRHPAPSSGSPLMSPSGMTGSGTGIRGIPAGSIRPASASVGVRSSGMPSPHLSSPGLSSPPPTSDAARSKAAAAMAAKARAAARLGAAMGPAASVRPSAGAVRPSSAAAASYAHAQHRPDRRYEDEYDDSS
jgi:hypothetical protein